MPYIYPHRRLMVDKEGAAVTGELCYQIYKAMLEYTDGARAFSKFAEVLGAVEAAKLEYYRTQVAPYEQEKLEAHGDVY